MNFDVSALTNTMTDAVRGAIGDRWSAIRDVAEPELRKLAETLEDVNQLHAGGRIDADRAWELVDMQRKTALTVVKTVQGLGILTARRAVEAATQAAGAVVNRLIGFTLL